MINQTIIIGVGIAIGVGFAIDLGIDTEVGIAIGIAMDIGLESWKMWKDRFVAGKEDWWRGWSSTFENEMNGVTQCFVTKDMQPIQSIQSINQSNQSNQSSKQANEQRQLNLSISQV